MEQINQIRKDPSAAHTMNLLSNQADIRAHNRVREATPNIRKPAEDIGLEINQQSLGNKHARKAYMRLYHHACDQFKRADRDLGETAAFVAASLTTATAIEAVMTVANDKLGLSKDIL
jgi:hypothetical protein